MQLSYQVSLHIAGQFCAVHSIGPAVTPSKQGASIHVCCEYFREELKQELESYLGADFVKNNIRFKLPVIPPTGISGKSNFEE